MFELLTERLRSAFKLLRPGSRFTAANTQDTLQKVRLALLEADVAQKAVDLLIERLSAQVIDQPIVAGFSPEQAFIKIVHEVLIQMMGKTHTFNLDVPPPMVILMVGPQGVGKTTMVAKLARWLKEEKKKSVLVTSTDVTRPAALDQLEYLSKSVDVDFYRLNSDPIEIAQKALLTAKKDFVDILIVDTAGRLTNNAVMMQQLQRLHQVLKPAETLLVLDSMMGQNSVEVAEQFNQQLTLTGVLLTKMDSDARGGVALSIHLMLEKPIIFIGTGEKPQALELFHPDRIASRILGMGDVLTLIEEVQRNIDEKQAKSLAKKIQREKGFDLEDFLEQLKQMEKMGGVSRLLEKIPGANKLSQASNLLPEQHLEKMRDIILSMTPQERRFPNFIMVQTENARSRRNRIARGSGRTSQDVNQTLRQFDKMRKMAKRFARPGAMKKFSEMMQR